MNAEERKPKKLSATSTKKEMLDAYNELLQELDEKSKATLSPQKVVEEKQKQAISKKADELTAGSVIKSIGDLKLEISGLLSKLSDTLEKEVNKYGDLQKAVELKESELKEIYEIEKSAYTLATLIETQNKKREEYENDMSAKRKTFEEEIEQIKKEWEKEKKQYELQLKERDLAERKTREREKEEYLYNFEREQKLAKDTFEDEKLKFEKEIKLKKEELERDIALREQKIAERENELNEFRQKVSQFPKELEAAVSKAIRENTERLKQETKNQEDLLKKEFAGEKNVLDTRIAILEKINAEQSAEIKELSKKLEAAYQKVQDIALKTIEGASSTKSYNELQKIFSEKQTKSSQDK